MILAAILLGLALAAAVGHELYAIHRSLAVDMPKVEHIAPVARAQHFGAPVTDYACKKWLRRGVVLRVIKGGLA